MALLLHNPPRWWVLLLLVETSILLPEQGTALTAPPLFAVDLDKEPSQRWNGAVKAVLDAHPFEWSFERAFAAHNESLFNNITDAQFTAIGSGIYCCYINIVCVPDLLLVQPA